MERCKIYELSQEAQKALFLGNDHLKTIMEQEAADMAEIIFNDIADYFSHKNTLNGRTDRSAAIETDNYNRAIVTSKDYEQFILDCSKLDDDYSFLTDTSKNLLERLYNKVELYKDYDFGYITDLSDEQERNFSRWFENGLETLENELAGFITDEIESYFDLDYMLDEFLYRVDAMELFENYETDGRFVYFETCKG